MTKRSDLRERVRHASRLLRSLASEHRFLILCLLLDGEKSVRDLMALTGLRQSTLSQHLSRLRMEGLIKPRREAQRMFYSLSGHESHRVLRAIAKHLC